MIKKNRSIYKQGILYRIVLCIARCFVFFFWIFTLDVFILNIFLKSFLTKIIALAEIEIYKRNIIEDFFFFQLEKHLRSWIIFRFFYVLLFLKILILIKWKLLYVISIFKTRTFAYLHSKSMFLYAYDRAQWTGLTIHSGPEPTGS